MTFGGGVGGSPLTPPIACLGSPTAPRLRREGSWGVGRGQSVPRCLRGPGAGSLELPRETLTDALNTPGHLLPPLLCPPGCLTCAWVPPSPLTLSVRGLGCLSPPPRLQHRTCSLAGAKKGRNWCFLLRWLTSKPPQQLPSSRGVIVRGVTQEKPWMAGVDARGSMQVPGHPYLICCGLWGCLCVLQWELMDKV